MRRAPAFVVCCLLQHAATAGAFVISSPAFHQGAAIPKKYTCDRADISPPLGWVAAPPGTRSFAVVAEAPDVAPGSPALWLLWNLPGGTTGIRQGFASSEPLPGGAREGRNDFGKIGYTGPCPAPGKVHFYYFRVYALRVSLDLERGATKADVFRAMRPHLLGVAELMGTARRVRAQLGSTRSPRNSGCSVSQAAAPRMDASFFRLM